MKMYSASAMIRKLTTSPMNLPNGMVASPDRQRPTIKAFLSGQNKTNHGHDDIEDQRIDYFGECGADYHAYCQVDHIAL